MKADAMRAKTQKIPKEEIELKHNVMLEKVSDIQVTILKKRIH